METIFLLVNYTPDDPSVGITKKISAQIKSLRNLGYVVYYTAYKNTGVEICDNNDQPVCHMKYTFKPGTKLYSYFRYQDILRLSLRFIGETQVIFDYLYGRISAMNSKYMALLKEFKCRGSKVIIEALAYFPGVKMRTPKGIYVVYCLKRRRHQLKKLIDKVITEGKLEDFYGIRCEVGKIGVETDNLFEHRYMGNTDELNMITVASEQPYHGYDRLIRSVAAYKESGGCNPIKVHIVGKLSDSTKALVQQLNVSDIVILHGKMYGQELEALYQRCNMGIGPLGQHRVGGKKDTGLKTKEYFGIGLPYFYSGCDEDVPEDYPYICKVPSDESYIDFDHLWEFYLSYRDCEDVATKMRNFAKDVYSWDVIMRDALIL